MNFKPYHIARPADWPQIASFPHVLPAAGQAGRRAGCWGDLGDPLSGTRLQLSLRATETVLHRSCGPEAWSRCMPSIESIGRVSARSGNEQDRLVSIAVHSSRASPSRTGGLDLMEANGGPRKFPQRQNLARLGAAVGVLKRRREIHGRPNLGFPRTNRKKEGQYGERPSGLVGRLLWRGPP